MTRRTLALSVGLLICLVGCSTPSSKGPSDPRAAEVASLLVGTFSSRAQSEAQPSYRDVTLRMAPIWTDRTDAHWFYVEQAMASAPDRPYRQRVYRVSQDADGTVESMVLSLPGDPLPYAGAWRQPAPLNELVPDLLRPLDGCVVFLEPAGPGRFQGGTRGTGCASTRDGAAYTTSEITLEPGLIQSWDRGFDARGTQVWGATEGGYRFVRISTRPDAPLPTAPAGAKP